MNQAYTVNNRNLSVMHSGEPLNLVVQIGMAELFIFYLLKELFLSTADIKVNSIKGQFKIICMKIVFSIRFY